ncbi:hypothetical protein ANANG_G00269480 [Anguilla anguilla]|uniref:Ig-like domain-containing protein n=1 Tax=Anguilla anguilla TaxID=7936 RepID=A0A9D3LUS9_ANGAN|nr:hypothetical protein ANANG_G00269480 [Anguilla anguilla]
MVKSAGVGRGGLDPGTVAAVSWVAAVCLSAGVAVAMQVTSTGPQTIQKAQGEKVTLECLYSRGPTDIGELDIEWSLISPDMTQKDTLILSFAAGRKWIHGGPAVMSGLDFRAGDPSQGDASIVISAAEVSHTGTYQCKVKSAPGVDMRKVTLLVLVRPSVPNAASITQGESRPSSQHHGVLPPSTARPPRGSRLLCQHHARPAAMTVLNQTPPRRVSPLNLQRGPGGPLRASLKRGVSRARSRSPRGRPLRCRVAARPTQRAAPAARRGNRRAALMNDPQLRYAPLSTRRANQQTAFAGRRWEFCRN